MRGHRLPSWSLCRRLQVSLNHLPASRAWFKWEVEFSSCEYSVWPVLSDGCTLLYIHDIIMSCADTYKHLLKTSRDIEMGRRCPSSNFAKCIGGDLDSASYPVIFFLGEMDPSLHCFSCEILSSCSNDHWVAQWLLAMLYTSSICSFARLSCELHSIDGKLINLYNSAYRFLLHTLRDLWRNKKAAMLRIQSSSCSPSYIVYTMHMCIYHKAGVSTWTRYYCFSHSNYKYWMFVPTTEICTNSSHVNVIITLYHDVRWNIYRVTGWSKRRSIVHI